MYIDDYLTNTVPELRAYAKDHPEATSVSVALNRILDALIEGSVGKSLGSDEVKLAISQLEEVASLFPESPVPLLRLSKLCLDRGDIIAALQYAEAGLTIKPDDPDLLFNRALALLNTGKNEEAIQGFKQYIELNPGYPWSYNNIGDTYRSLGLYDQAEYYLKQSLIKDNRFIPAYYNLAMLYLDQQEWLKCLQFAQVAAKHGDFNKEIQLALGEAYMGLKQPQSAVQHLLFATLADRYFVPAYETLSAAYLQLEMYELSVAAAREALKIDPVSWRAMANIGVSCSKQGKHTEAISFLADALKHNPDPEGEYKICWELGWEHLLIDQYPQALEYTERAIQLKKNANVILLFNKGLILLAQGNIQESNAVYAQAIARANMLNDHAAIFEGANDMLEFTCRKGIVVEPASPLSLWLNDNPAVPI